MICGTFRRSPHFARIVMAITNLSAALQDAVSLAQAAELLPAKPHVATVWRWATHGIRGVRLQTWTVGGRRFTTIPALEQFLQVLNTSGSAHSHEENDDPDQEDRRAS